MEQKLVTDQQNRTEKPEISLNMKTDNFEIKCPKACTGLKGLLHWGTK